MKNCLSHALALLLALMTFATQGVAAPSETSKARIGVILPLHGPFAKYGQRIQNGLQNSKLSTFELLLEDEGCDPKVAITAYKKLSEVDGIELFLGPWCGTPQIAVAPLIKAKKQLAVLGSSAPAAVFPLSGERMFSTQHTIESESEFMAQSVYRLGFRKVAIVFFDNQFSRAHEKSFRQHFAGSVAKTFAYTSQDISELKTIALKIRQLGVDAVFVPDAFPLMAGFVKELAQVGLASLPIFSVYSAQSEDALAAMGKYGEGFVYSYPDIGSADALDYFPGLAAKIMGEAASSCGENIDCIRGYITGNYPFTKEGVLEGKLKLKTIHDGQFTDLSPQLETKWIELHQAKK
ncbi:MAG: ABC transporter substrate-binding protein [Deltaproteobacteria bacterium]|nr:ABC transporter substrate-binding protein [Deltaproteobacteria bacterium]